MTKLTLNTLSGALLIAVSHAVFAEDPSYVAYADVLSSKPVYQSFEQRIPQKQCWIETVREEIHHQPHNSATSTVMGSVIGGAIGNAVGHGGDNKKIGTAVGALLGGVIGNDIGKKHRQPARTEVAYRDIERCEIREKIETRRELVGFDVNYRFQGETYTTHLTHEPGDRIKLAVRAVPLQN